MYFIPFIVLSVFTIIEIQEKDKRHYLFYAAFLFLTIAICLRYGQGTDYFGYMNVFKAGSWRNRIYNSKNIQSYINQNNYEGYNVITYPYYSIWNKEEAKKVAPDMWEDMEMWIEMQELQQMKQQGD